ASEDEIAITYSGEFYKSLKTCGDVASAHREACLAVKIKTSTSQRLPQLIINKTAPTFRFESTGQVGQADPEVGESISILIADDHPLIRDLLSSHLERFGMKTVGSVGTAQEAVNRCRSDQPDVLILDYEMEGKSSLVAIQEIKALPRPPAILVFSGYDSADIALQCDEHGADGYLNKKDAVPSLVKAIRTVREGEKFTAFDNLKVENPRAAGRDIGQLTSRETLVLRGVASGYSLEVISERLSLSLSDVVHDYGRLCAKLEVESTDVRLVRLIAIHEGIWT
ncbi:MAG: response regulator transcription factor, partial [Acidobacteriota bacterium]